VPHPQHPPPQVLSSELRAPVGSVVPALRPTPPGGDASPNVLDTLFGVNMEVTLTCTATDAEPPVVKHEFHRKLVCTIEGGAGKTVQINHMHEGLAYGMTGEVEKRSDILDTNVVWKRVARITSLPKYLAIQFMRFYWKATPDSRDHAGVKCKMLRPVTFPADNFDVFDLCAPVVQKALKVERDRVAEAALPSLAKRARIDHDAAAPAPGAAAAGGAGASSDSGDALAAALAATSTSTPAASPASASAAPAMEPLGYGLPAGFRGLYGEETRGGGGGGGRCTSCSQSTPTPTPPLRLGGGADLFALVTHKGRSADSGHYIGWVRKRQTDPTAPDNAWLVFDDDTVSEVDTAYVTGQLKGGADDHMAYLAFYVAKGGETEGSAATAAGGK